MRAASAVTVAADRDLDLDVPLLDVATLVQVDGNAPVNIAFEYAETSARFTDTATGVAYSFGYEFLVAAGTYDVDLLVNDARDAPGAPTSAPLRAAQCIVVE